MKQPLVLLALVAGLAGTALAGYALSLRPAGGGELESRVEQLELELGRVEAELGALREATRPPPSLMGVSPEGIDRPTAGGSLEGLPSSEAEIAAMGGGAADGSGPKEGPASEEALSALVDKAVEKKATQMRIMANKKPAIDQFADVLELNDEQRTAVEAEVLRGQEAIRTILEVPAEDGTVFMDELVEVIAFGIANPGKPEAHQRGVKLFTRLMSEKPPGSDLTYAAQAEAVKSQMREQFKRDMTPKQYATFEAWQMDPSEVQKVPGSPWKDVERRALDRARALGATIPGDDGPK